MTTTSELAEAAAGARWKSMDLLEKSDVAVTDDYADRLIARAQVWATLSVSYETALLTLR